MDEIGCFWDVAFVVCLLLFLLERSTIMVSGDDMESERIFFQTLSCSSRYGENICMYRSDQIRSIIYLMQHAFFGRTMGLFTCGSVCR